MCLLQLGFAVFIFPVQVVADENTPAAEDGGTLSPEEPPPAAVETVANDTVLPAASDVTLTSEVVDEQLPVERKAAGQIETVADVEPVQRAAAAAAADRDAATAADDRETSSAPKELPEAETESETRVYIDVTGANFPAWKAREAKRPSSKLRDGTTATTAEQKPRGGEPKETLQQQQVETADDLGQKDVEAAAEVMPESAEERASGDAGDDVAVETSAAASIECSAPDDDQKMDDEVEAMPPIEVPCSDDDDDDDDGRDSPSVFSTCDEWLESPGSPGKMRADQLGATCLLPTLSEHIASCDSVSELAEPDDVDVPPLAPRREAPPASETLWAASADTVSAKPPMPGGNTANVCCHQCTRADRPASYRTSSGQPSATMRRPHSAVSPSLGGRIPSLASPQRSKFARPPTPGASRVSTTRPATVASNRGAAASPLMPQQQQQPYEARAARGKPPTCWQKPRKPAWK